MKDLSICERKIIGALLVDAIEQGLLISVYDGEVWTVKVSASLREIRDAIGTTDMTVLRFRKPAMGGDTDKSPKSVGSVVLIHGNECDVISDYTDNEQMAALLKRASAIADNLALVQ